MTGHAGIGHDLTESFACYSIIKHLYSLKINLRLSFYTKTNLCEDSLLHSSHAACVGVCFQRALCG